jgi:hypothetical protein
MKVMCINDGGFSACSDNVPTVGEIVTVAAQCPVFSDNWDIAEYLSDSKGRPQSFKKKCFAPLSEIDEMELVNERQLQES